MISTGISYIGFSFILFICFWSFRVSFACMFALARVFFSSPLLLILILYFAVIHSPLSSIASPFLNLRSHSHSLILSLSQALVIFLFASLSLRLFVDSPVFLCSLSLSFLFLFLYLFSPSPLILFSNLFSIFLF